MDIPVNRFKRDITSAAPLYGAWLMGSSPTAAEALACTGFDFLVVDMEHTPIELFQAVEILRAIDELHPALVAMGTHGRTGLAHLLLGSVTEKVVRSSSAPVITVHAKAR